MDILTLGQREKWDEQKLSESDRLLRVVEVAFGAERKDEIKDNTQKIEEAVYSLLKGFPCGLIPLSNNFNQDPTFNSRLKDGDLEAEKRYVADTRSLWNPSDVINFQFIDATEQDVTKIRDILTKGMQPYIGMRLVYNGGSSEGVVRKIRIVTSSGGQGWAGRACVGKVGSGGCMSGDHMQLVRQYISNYVVLHEMGHMLGLQHQFETNWCQQKGYVCKDDPQSIMNYNPRPNELSTLDKQWLMQTYKGNGTIGPTPPIGTSDKRPPPEPTKKEPKPPPPTTGPSTQPPPPTTVQGSQSPPPPPPPTTGPVPPNDWLVFVDKLIAYIANLF